MANLKGFDANKVEPSVSFDPVPAGKYLAVITDSEMKPTKSGAGRFLQLTFQIIEGQFKNRYIWARLNLENANQTAVNIARGELSAICRAVGVMAPNDSCELHNLPLTISVKCTKRADTGEVQNEIKGYSKRSAPVVQATEVGSDSRPPWARG